MTPDDDFFAHLDAEPKDKLDELLSRQTNRPIEQINMALGEENPGYREKCRKCGGSGRFISYGRFGGRDLGACFSCNGQGYHVFKRPPEVRNAKRERRAERKEEMKQSMVDTFATNFPGAWAWICENFSNSDFAKSMSESVRKFGSLTERQLAVINTRIAEAQERKAAAERRVTEAKTISMAKITEAFSKAGDVLKSPKLRVTAGLVLSPAKANSKNAGGIYVKRDDTYLGKIIGDKFIRSRDCTDELEAVLLKVAEAPQEAAVAFGRLTGHCACCGRLLFDPISVKRGIGPICSSNFGW